jgi:hypothetical protein
VSTRRPISALDEQVRCLLRAAKSNAGYKLLPDGTWSSGGCWSLAEALRRRIGGDLFAVYGRAQWQTHGIPQHVVLRYGSRFLDADGWQSESKLLRTWETREMIADPELLPVDKDCVLIESGLGARREALWESGIELDPDVVDGLQRLWDAKCSRSGLGGLFGSR